MFVKNNYLILSLCLALMCVNIRNQRDSYATLSIPAVHLEKTIYKKNSKYNQLEYGLYLLPNSTDITDEKANIIIASHSGNAKISYFKNLDQIKLNDEIKWIQNEETYLFRVINIYEAEKNGRVKIKQYDNKTLSLVTCKKNSTHLHLIVSAIYIGKIEKEK